MATRATGSREERVFTGGRDTIAFAVSVTRNRYGVPSPAT
jgi:hypothetical protein